MSMATVGQRSIRRFTSDEVWQMLEVGLLGEHEPYELIDGELRYVSPQSPRHAQVIRSLWWHLAEAYRGSGQRVGVRLPIAGIADSIPEPDIAVAPAGTTSVTHHLRAADAVLLVEVSQSSAQSDRDTIVIDAAAGAAEYWIVDLAAETIGVFRGPQANGTWAVRLDIGSTGVVRPPGTDAAMQVAAILHP